MSGIEYEHVYFLEAVVGISVDLRVSELGEKKTTGKTNEDLLV